MEYKARGAYGGIASVGDFGSVRHTDPQIGRAICVSVANGGQHASMWLREEDARKLAEALAIRYDLLPPVPAPEPELAPLAGSGPGKNVLQDRLIAARAKNPNVRLDLIGGKVIAATTFKVGDSVRVSLPAHYSAFNSLSSEGRTSVAATVYGEECDDGEGPMITVQDARGVIQTVRPDDLTAN